MGEAKRRRDAIARGEGDPGPSAPTPRTRRGTFRFCAVVETTAKVEGSPVAERQVDAGGLASTVALGLSLAQAMLTRHRRRMFGARGA